MAADYNKPVNTDNYADILEQLRGNIAAAQTMLNDLTGVANIPTNAIRYDQTLNKFQSYNGSTFDDLVLSPSGGGTGITNWAKASTAEAKAGTANKYPDAAGVLASISKNRFEGTLVWSGTAPSLDLSSIAGGYPGDGIYLVRAADSGTESSTDPYFTILVKSGDYTISNSIITTTTFRQVYCNDSVTLTANEIAFSGGATTFDILEVYYCV